MAFQTIGFIGLGLIGGSIAKKMKSNQPDIKIYATAHHKETIQEAYREGLIENNDLLPLSAFSDCDYIFLCAPVQRNLAYLRQLKDIIRSKKMPVVRLENVNYEKQSESEAQKRKFMKK